MGMVETVKTTFLLTFDRHGMPRRQRPRHVVGESVVPLDRVHYLLRTLVPLSYDGLDSFSIIPGRDGGIR